MEIGSVAYFSNDKLTWNAQLKLILSMLINI